MNEPEVLVTTMMLIRHFSKKRSMESLTEYEVLLYEELCRTMEMYMKLGREKPEPETEAEAA